jgi:hypothetical protein
LSSSTLSSSTLSSSTLSSSTLSSSSPVPSNLSNEQYLLLKSLCMQIV